MESYRRFLRVEDRLESKAMYEIWVNLSFTDAMRNHPREMLLLDWPSFEIKRDRKGNETGRTDVLVHASDIVNSKTWKKFLQFKGYVNEELIRLVDAETLAKEYAHWLLNNYTDRYRNLDFEGQEWLRKVTFRSVQWLIGENKHRGWMQCEDQDNPDKDYWATPEKPRKNLYEHIYVMRTLEMRGTAKATTKAVKNIIRNPEDKALRDEVRQDLIQVHHDSSDESLNKLHELIKQEVTLQEKQWEEQERREAQKQSSGNWTGEAAV